MVRSRTVAGALLVGCVVSGLFAGTRPEFDAAAPADSRAARVPFEPGPAERAKLRPGLPVQADERLGLPTFLWAARGPALRSLGALQAEGAARQHLADYASFYGLAPDEVAGAVVRHVHDTGRGLVIVKLKQVVDGIDVFRDELNVAMDRDHELLALSGYLVGRARLAHGASRARFDLDAVEAIAAAYRDLTEESLEPSELAPTGRAAGGYAWYESAKLVEPARARRTWFRLADRLEPAFYVELDDYAYVISAVDGRVLFRHNLVADDAFAYRVWADTGGLRQPFDGPQGTAPSPHPTGAPNGYQAPFVAPNMVTLQNGPISTNDPWLPPGAVETTGNNAEAYADFATPDGFSAGDLRATVTSPGVFDRTYDTSLGPQTSNNQEMAAITQLFYDVNFFHDWYYDVGFDEAAGNGQLANYGRGGLESDSIKAEAQDFGGRNNANMRTPADGSRPRMQMYVFDGRSLRNVTVNSPAPLAGLYGVGIATTFGPQAFNLTAGVVLANDGSTAGGGTAADACQPLTNGVIVAGNIAFVDRGGGCSFTSKVAAAQLAGAVGVIIANNTAGFSNMTGTDASIVIPTLMISQADGNALRTSISAASVAMNATLVREATVDRDGTIDNAVVAHEWGHYISNRLIGDASGLANNQGGSMGEGWGDFHALLLMVRPEDAGAPANANFGGAYGAVNYVTSGSPNGPFANNGYYFGIRRVPYSTDFTRNALTFQHIANGVPLPATAPVAFGASGASNAEVHNSGEVWATMLWECYAALLRDSGRLTFDEARDRMRSYLVAAYKLTPPVPTFLEARDAVLAAALAGDPADYALFWQAFARRGAGLRAVAPDRYSNTHAGVIESYVAGNDLQFVGASLDDSVTWCDLDGVLDDNETGRLTLEVKNVGTGALAATTATVGSGSPGVTFPHGNVASFPASQPGQTVAAAVDVKLDVAPGIQPIDFTVSFNDPGLAIAGPIVVTPALRGNSDVDAAQAAFDDVESDHTVWTAAHDPALDPSGAWTRIAVTGRDHRWAAQDAVTDADQYLISPVLDVAPSGTFSFSFRHRYSFEFSGSQNFDGGVLEISTDGGTSWTDIGGSASPGYNGTLVTGTNPLSGRSAFVAISAGYPAFITATVNLGTTYQGQSVRVRFRLGSDPAAVAPGWEVDDIAFTNITNTPFDALTGDHAICLDTDGDATSDLTDCAVFDASLWAAPTPARSLLFSSKTFLSWFVPASPGATTSTLYDVLRSNSASSFAAAFCLESDETNTSASDGAVPAVSSVFHYLVRAQNACGSTLGVNSAGVPRSGVACP